LPIFHHPIGNGREVSLLTGRGFARDGEDLSRPDAVRILDLVLIGEIDRRVADATAVDPPRNAPQRIAAPDDHRAGHILQLRSGDLLPVDDALLRLRARDLLATTRCRL